MRVLCTLLSRVLALNDPLLMFRARVTPSGRRPGEVHGPHPHTHPSRACIPSPVPQQQRQQGTSRYCRRSCSTRRVPSNFECPCHPKQVFGCRMEPKRNYHGTDNSRSLRRKTLPRSAHCICPTLRQFRVRPDPSRRSTRIGAHTL